jgi:hypothetical protein
MMHDPNYIDAVNIFMLLNHQNDGYLDYDSMKDLIAVITSQKNIDDQGKIYTDIQFKEMFDALGKKNVDIDTFKLLLDDTQINISNVSNELYNR